MENLELGYDIPARPGMAAVDVLTPCLIVDLDAVEANVIAMGQLVKRCGLAHRAHGKMHKSVDMAKLQQRLGGAVGMCCQKVSEAEAFARGGITDILVSNQIRSEQMLVRLARLAAQGTQITICVDDLDNVVQIETAAAQANATISVLVEFDCGQGRCGTADPAQVLVLAQAVEAAPHLTFAGLQAYQGAIQHVLDHTARKEACAKSHAATAQAIATLTAAGLPPKTVTGAGTGTLEFDAASRLYTEVQCGSYAFMDAGYAKVQGAGGASLVQDWQHALFVATRVISCAKPSKAVVDAGHKSHAIDSGLPHVHCRADLTYHDPSDDHGVIDDPNQTLGINDMVWLVPGHCDPTVNLHDWMVCVRGGVVECLWPVSARGKLL